MNLTMAVDFYDMVWVSEKVFDKESIDKFIAQCAQNGINRILWRVSVGGQLFYHTNTPDRLQNLAIDQKGKYYSTHHEILKKALLILNEFDPLKTAVDSCHKWGVEIYPWLTIYDDWSYMGEFASSLMKQNPKLSWASQDNSEYLLGVTSYVYDEVVDFRIRQIKELLSYDINGIHLSLRSHSRPPEYLRELKDYLTKNPQKSVADFANTQKDGINNIMKKAHGKYGFDSKAVSEYIRLTGKIPEKDSTEWLRFRGGYLLRFLQKVKKLVNIREVGLSLWWRTQYYPPFPNEFYRWDDIAKENIADDLCYVLPEIAKDFPVCFPELTKYQNNASIWFFTSDATNNVKKRLETIRNALNSKLFNNVCFFEAMDFYKNPSYWEMARELKNIKTEESEKMTTANCS
jgi:hypothetical protein